MAPECLDADSHDVMSADGMRKLISALRWVWGNLNSARQFARERKQEKDTYFLVWNLSNI